MNYHHPGLINSRRIPPKEAEGPEIGDTVTFLPAALIINSGGQSTWNYLASYGQPTDLRVTATVVYVNRDHRWYRAEYRTRDGSPAYECFKF